MAWRPRVWRRRWWSGMRGGLASPLSAMNLARPITAFSCRRCLARRKPQARRDCCPQSGIRNRTSRYVPVKRLRRWIWLRVRCKPAQANLAGMNWCLPQVRCRFCRRCRASRCRTFLLSAPWRTLRASWPSTARRWLSAAAFSAWRPPRRYAVMVTVSLYCTAETG